MYHVHQHILFLIYIYPILQEHILPVLKHSGVTHSVLGSIQPLLHTTSPLLMQVYRPLLC